MQWKELFESVKNGKEIDHLKVMEKFLKYYLRDALILIILGENVIPDTYAMHLAIHFDQFKEAKPMADKIIFCLNAEDIDLDLKEFYEEYEMDFECDKVVVDLGTSVTASEK